MKHQTIILRRIGFMFAIPFVLYLAIIVYFYCNQNYLLFQNQHVIETPRYDKLDIKDVRIKTPDGEILQAWYEPAKPNRPTILYLHGNASTLDMGKWRYIRMHKQGVGFLALAYRGYSASSGTPSEKGLFIDCVAAYDWLISQGVKHNEIIIHGHSLGSGAATYLAGVKPARALILESPFTSAVDTGKSHYPFLPVSMMMKNRFENYKRIQNVHIPTIIAHGTNDVVIPFSEGKELFALANNPKSFVEMKYSDHNTLPRDGVYDYYWKFIGLEPMDFAPNIKIEN